MAADSRDGGGYGKPPKDSQFAKGRSGNPKGRPKRVRSFKDDLTAELQKKQKALVRALTKAAMTDPAALKTLLAFMRHFGVGKGEEVVETWGEMDYELFESQIRQHEIELRQDEIELRQDESQLRQDRIRQKRSRSDSAEDD